MSACCLALGLRGSFFATPTAIFASIAEGEGRAETTLERVSPGDHDLARLAELYEIRDAVVGRQLSPEQGIERIRAVLDAQVRGGAGSAVAIAAAGAGAAVLLGGGWAEVAVAGGAGCAVGALALLALRWPRLAEVQAPLATAVVAFLVSAVAANGVPLHVPLATVAAIVVLLPGLSFTSALAELAMRHLAAGSARLMGALATLLTMAIGVGLGGKAGVLLFGAAPVVEPTRLAWPWLVAALLVTWLAFAVSLRASPRQWPWVLVGMAAGYGGARIGAQVLGGELGAFLGAAMVAAAANLFARWRRRPAAIVRTPGLLLLVPGSLGFRGLYTALDQDFAASAQFAFQMLLVGGAIVAGQLIAGVAVPPPLEVEPDAKGRTALM